jgi:hypothetical protein
MKYGKSLLLAAAACLAWGCEAKIGNNANEASANGQASAEGKAKEGQVALSAPGFDIKLNIPLDRAPPPPPHKILYPGSNVTGLYIAAHPKAKSGSDGEVELRFASSDPPETVAAWYRDPARAADFALSSDGKEGAAFVMAGTRKDDEGGFRLRLEPKSGGTDGRILFRDKN